MVTRDRILELCWRKSQQRLGNFGWEAGDKGSRLTPGYLTWGPGRMELPFTQDREVGRSSRPVVLAACPREKGNTRRKGKRCCRIQKKITQSYNISRADVCLLVFSQLFPFLIHLHSYFTNSNNEQCGVVNMWQAQWKAFNTHYLIESWQQPRIKMTEV